jgi:hypothetical protein
LNANIENPNDTADGFPGDNATSISFSPASQFETTQVIFQINTDNYGSETTWSIKDSSNTIIAFGGPYANNVTINQTITLPADGCYTFQINDSQNDGICCQYGNGSYSLKTPNNTTIIEGGNFGASQAITFNAVANLSTDDFSGNNFLKVYPNPSSGMFNLSFDTTTDFQFEVYNILGQSVKQGRASSNQFEINLTENTAGIYLLKVTDVISNKTKNFKLIKK